jgi:hypothetical protein
MPIVFHGRNDFNHSSLLIALMLLPISLEWTVIVTALRMYVYHVCA